MHIIVGFILFCIILIGICAYIGAKSQFSKKSKYSHYKFYEDDDDEDDIDFCGDDFESSVSSSSDGKFYGGIPMGKHSIYFTDDDDFLDEFGDDIL